MGPFSPAEVIAMFDFATLPQRNRNPKRARSCRPRVEWMEPRTLLSAVTWTGGAGDNNWDTPANWSTDSVPGSADDVTIDIAANVVHSDDVTDSIHSLTSTEPLTISGGTLSIASASTIGGALTIGIPSSSQEAAARSQAQGQRERQRARDAGLGHALRLRRLERQRWHADQSGGRRFPAGCPHRQQRRRPDRDVERKQR